MEGSSVDRKPKAFGRTHLPKRRRILGVALLVLLSAEVHAGSLIDSVTSAIARVSGIQEEVDEILSPHSVCTPRLDDLPPPGILAGARRAFVEVYQTCSVLDEPPIQIPPQSIPQGVETLDTDEKGTFTFRRLKDREAYVRTNPYLSAIGRSVPSPDFPDRCLDPRLRPPIYGYGSRPGFTRSAAGEAQLELNQDRSVTGCLPVDQLKGQSGNGRSGIACGGGSIQAIDCAGFIGTAFALEGLAIRPGKGIRPGLDGTYAYREAADDPESCLSALSLRLGEPPFIAGDLFVTGGGHMVIFDSVGPDPLGIGKVSDCEELTPALFDFTILQSSPFGGEIGVQRTQGSSFYGDTRPHMTEFLAMARAYCRFRKSNAPGKFEAKSTKGAILRHKGDLVSGCVDPSLKRRPVPECSTTQHCDLRGDGSSRGGSG